ncbi:Uncharacterised protein [Moraxella cuniculi]|uniref:Uncharacterized protein n=1 Tax=Moraxella cuniculi TaxID=34061 RepID=A0A3S4R173_9GAMM|nr:Uncharacterised protein [Moraxella cuniculi]
MQEIIVNTVLVTLLINLFYLITIGIVSLLLYIGLLIRIATRRIKKIHLERAIRFFTIVSVVPAYPVHTFVLFVV